MKYNLTVSLHVVDLEGTVQFLLIAHDAIAVSIKLLMVFGRWVPIQSGLGRNFRMILRVVPVDEAYPCGKMASRS